MALGLGLGITKSQRLVPAASTDKTVIQTKDQTDIVTKDGKRITLK